MSENRYGGKSKLRVTAKPAGGRTVLSDVSFTAPFKVTSPFYDEKGRMSVTLISVSAGIMSGDSQEIAISVEDGARLDVTSQAFEKMHRMGPGDFAARRSTLSVGKDAALVYSPLPVIPFKDSAFRNETEIRLADSSSRLFLSEIISCGRASRGERFQFREHISLTKAYEKGKLIYSDNAVYLPGEMSMEDFCLFEGYTHMGGFLMINFGISPESAGYIREAVYAMEGGVGGVTQTGHGDYCVRALAEGSEPLMALGAEMRDVLGL